jgi:type IV pilus assembly protein PilA
MLKNKKGFTLIELLIVVAIIAILAAIAIPQFSQYRIKGYNSAATADLRNGRTAEEAFFSDWQCYASSGGNGAAGDGTVRIPGTAPVAGNATQYPIVIGATQILAASNYPSADTVLQVGLSQNVNMVINTDAASSQSFTMASKNSSGDRCFAMDSDITTVLWVNAQTGGLQATLQSSVPRSDDLTGKNGGASCAGLAVGGQTTWTNM